MVFVTVLGDGLTFDQFHHEVRPTTVGRAGIEYAGDVRMVHERQGLTFRLEAGDHLPRIHARLDDLEGYLATDRLVLLSHVHDAHAAFTDLLQQLVRADPHAGALQPRCIDRATLTQTRWRSVKRSLRDLMGRQQILEAAQQIWMARAGPLQIGLACLGRGLLQGGQENGSLVALVAVGHFPLRCAPACYLRIRDEEHARPGVLTLVVLATVTGDATLLIDAVLAFAAVSARGECSCCPWQNRLSKAHHETVRNRGLPHLT